jgi:mono/diheme cytochrome c family protein
MRRTLLKRITAIVAILVAASSIALGAIRALVLHPARLEGGAGARLFVEKGCAQCHHTDRRETKIGPGFEGLFDREKLPVSGRPVSEENVRKQLVDPYERMPSFSDRLTPKEMDALLDYLRSL